MVNPILYFFRKRVREEIKMKMIRVFHPIGQGAFYSEHFKFCSKRINVVYDCGSSTDTSYIKREVKNNFYKDEKVHALFISHLDEDHINGVPFLLEYCDVENIFFPLISSENKYFLKMWMKINGVQGFSKDFLENPHNAISNLKLNKNEIPKLIGVREYLDENGEMSYSRIEKVNSGENVCGMINNLNMPPFWLYIPFNFKQEERIKKLKYSLEEVFEKPISLSDLDKLWRECENSKEKIKEAYRKVPGSFNTNSMTLFSGAEKGVKAETMPLFFESSFQNHYEYFRNQYNLFSKLYIDYDIHFRFYRRYYEEILGPKEGGCLYLGDYDASGNEKLKQLRVAYKEWWYKIGCIQIPHHGSHYNFNSDLADMNRFYFVSAGIKNPYHHPHSKVITELLLNEHYPLIITENPESRVYIEVIYF